MPFKPGQSGNPKGRAQGSQNKITRALKEASVTARTPRVRRQHEHGTPWSSQAILSD
jgi:hypothetical protein